ncbi:hypothetical protein [Sinomicrobium sp. M5D2P9]
MKRSKRSHRVIALFLVFSMLPSLVPYNMLQASGNGPTAPEATGFEPVDATDMVNLVTGDFSYVLPLLNVPSPEGGYPLALAYHAGIAMDQEASWVGLGWSLNPGAINRNINNQPDDWKDGMKATVVRDAGGEQTTNSLYVGVGWGDENKSSVGLALNWSANRAFGGETTYNYSASGSFRSQGYNVGISSNGFNAGVGPISYNSSANGFNVGVGPISYNSSAGLGIDLSMAITQATNDKIYGNFSLYTKEGIGISLHSASGASISLVGDSQSASNSMGLISYSRGPKFSVNANFGIFRLAFTRQKIRYWTFDEKRYGNTGTLYAGGLNDILNDRILPYLHSFDASESLYRTDYAQEAAENNPGYLSYDQYNVAAQGIMGSISPYLLDSGYIHQPLRSFNNENVTVGSNNFKLRDVYSYVPEPFSKSVDATAPGNRVHFYFDGEYSSFYTTEPGNTWSYPSIFRGMQDFYSNTSISHENVYGEGYVSSKNRLKKGSFIESYTNKEIQENPSLVFDNVNRQNMPPDGIGAFKITVADGKTYHYALPVYQKEKFNRNTKSELNIDEKYIEEQALTPYATHWLVTAVTGPDYVDTNGDDKIDEGDYGYWVKFEYGKWSDGYGWRNPTQGFAYGENSKGYAWGVKEIYYLDKIKTRTHTALFVKEARADNKARPVKVGQDRNNLAWYDAVYYSWQLGIPRYKGTDGNIYYPGAYSLAPINTLSGAPGESATLVIDNGFYAEAKPHKTLRLKEIILLTNNKVPSVLNKVNGTEGNPALVSDFLFKERVRAEVSGPGGENFDTGYISYEDISYKGEYYKNILDEKDISVLTPNLKNDAIKVITFYQDYSLAGDSPNSEASTKGRLTLRGVGFKGKREEQIIPSYKFDYYNSGNFNPDGKDSWGFNASNPANWSLKEITTPVGGKIRVEYESDDYNMEVAVKGATAARSISGGGIRVRKIKLLDGNNNSYEKDYLYNIPESIGDPRFSGSGYISSGVTTFAPSQEEKEIPFANYLPAPNVLYEYVTVKDNDKFTRYHFKVYKPYQFNNGNYSLGDAMVINTIQKKEESIPGANSYSGKNITINTRKFDIKDNLASIGTLLEKEVFNNESQLLSKTENFFSNPENADQGVVKESYNNIKGLLGEYSSGVGIFKVNIDNTSKTKYTSAVTETVTSIGGHVNTTYVDKYDFITGQPLETRNVGSDGTTYLTKIVPAYTKYSAMRSMVDNPGNKNMLTQQAAHFKYKLDTQTRTPVGVGITTWKSWNNSVWRKHKTYTWKGEINADGTFKNFSDNFNWTTTGDSQAEEWQLLTEITKYNVYSNTLEVKDANNNHLSTKMGDNNTKVIATANTAYNNFFFSGAEYSSGNTLSGGVTKDASAVITTSRAHTGKKTIQVASNVKAFKATPGSTGTYRLSVWAHKSNYANTSVTSNEQNFNFNQEETIIAGDWVQLNFTIDVASGKEVSLTTTSGTAYYDDFRLHPVSSSMTSYVYNEYDELTCILGTNNMGTRYEYDAGGRLIKTYAEAANYESKSGGYKLIKEINYQYKEDADTPYTQLVLLPQIRGTFNESPEFSAITNGGSGYIEYRWALSEGDYSNTYDAWTLHSSRRYIMTCPDDNGSTVYYRCQVRDKVTGEIKTKSGNFVWECSEDIEGEN